jgi:hypothetical protein
MKRFFLYFLLILFIVGLAMLAYGFWNAKNIRLWASAITETKSRYDVPTEEKNVFDSLSALSGKNADDFKSGLHDFGSKLDSIAGNMESAKGEIEKLSAPIAAEPVKSELVNYYSQNEQQIKDLSSVVDFTIQNFEVTIIFDKMTPDTTIDEIRGMISDAKSKSGEINPDILPEEIKNSGIELKTSVYNYLDALDQYAAGNVGDRSQLDSSYSDFSQKESNFWDAKKKLAIYSNVQSMNILNSKIDNDLLVLRKVKFSIK